MNQQNDFSEESRELFSDAHKCWICGKNRADALHHIMGRGENESKVESSPLNAALVHNYSCHIDKHNLLKTNDLQHILLWETYHYLVKREYHLTKNDLDFMEKYFEVYYP